MLTIRLQRTGKKNQADFRIVLAEKEAPVKKKVVEVLGSYNPRKKIFQVKEERMRYWIAQRVELSDTMHNLLVDKKFVEGKKVKAFNIPKKPVEKAAIPTTPSADTAIPPSEGGDAASQATEAIAEVTAKVEEKSPSAEASGDLRPAEAASEKSE